MKKEVSSLSLVLVFLSYLLLDLFADMMLMHYQSMRGKHYIGMILLNLPYWVSLGCPIYALELYFFGGTILFGIIMATVIMKAAAEDKRGELNEISP